jgi:hypothetical protein
MIDEPWTLEKLEPSEQLDRRVERRLRAFAKARAPVRRAATFAKSSVPGRRAAPFFPLEHAIYVVLVTVYAIYAGARAVEVLRDAGARIAVPRLASFMGSAEIDEAAGASQLGNGTRGRAPRGI